MCRNCDIVQQEIIRHYGGQIIDPGPDKVGK